MEEGPLRWNAAGRGGSGQARSKQSAGCKKEEAALVFSFSDLGLIALAQTQIEKREDDHLAAATRGAVRSLRTATITLPRAAMSSSLQDFGWGLPCSQGEGGRIEPRQMNREFDKVSDKVLDPVLHKGLRWGF